MRVILEKLRRLSVTKILLIGYLIIIAVGAVLLALPISVKEGESFHAFDALFTSVSAACVTGLIRFDTFSHWSGFGQAVILVLIQIGGVGFMTLCVSAMTLTHKKIGLSFRSLAQNAMSSPELGGVVRMTKFIILITTVTEGVGTILLSLFFCPKLGFFQGLWYSVFHSVSAFCNAGFDLMGQDTPFSSFTGYSGELYVNLILMLLIIAGGLGFFVWRDLYDSRMNPGKFKLQTKIVLTITPALVIGGAALIYIFERLSPANAGESSPALIIPSLFQSVTSRTAGFNTFDLTAISQSSKLVMILLMFIGGSPGSTAGGIKTTTFAVLLSSVSATFRRRKSVEIFGRRLEDNITRTSSCVLVMYAALALVSSLILTNADGVGLLDSVFESVSAVATVGLSAGATPGLSYLSASSLIILMIFGRVGSLTILFAFSSEKNRTPSSLPLEKLQIG